MRLSPQQVDLYRVFLQSQHRLMQNDPNLKLIQERISKFLSYSATPFTNIEQHPVIKECRDMQAFVIETMYPGLKKEPMQLIPALPARLSLEQIDVRLQLFNKYMAYRLDHLYEWDCMISHFIAEMWRTANYFHYEESSLQDFDGWLYIHGYHDLVELIVIF